MKLARTTSALALTLAALLGSQAALAGTPAQTARAVSNAATTQQVETRLQPGPYAKYLQYKGMSQEQAIEEARRVGEEPQRQTVRVVVTPLTDLEKYDRAMGRSTRAERTVQVLASSPDSGDRSNASEASPAQGG
ncbi:hypothetical protein MW290_05615 [Aquincola tertiaricarbonis]|uniref:DUF4148 domain-containing protein n=1 Tax=Aquincola tertiaricarbonis TaxID=391953 RepID=A0ABY4S7Q7_AQUTE|nr:hypothetical protein [Aquincola tertiaricarbonis]URI08057.1 hypothetical protein MW290_05615 [Aquincola tertiaricarbonis]